MFLFRCHSSSSCNSRSTGYQIPLDLPPGGARILAEDLFGMLSSIWAPGEAEDGDHESLVGKHLSSSIIFSCVSIKCFS